MLGQPHPAAADGIGKRFALEKPVSKVYGGYGFADIWRRDHFVWEYKESRGLPSGVPGLDLMTRGYQPGEITIIGAKSGVGKTSLLIQSAIANVSQGDPVLFSLEMTR